jgi:hypothetical protein
MSIRNALAIGNVFEDFEASVHAADPQGWGSNHPGLAMAIDAVRPRLIIEVGVWKGMSAITMARHARSVGLETEVLCIDTWLGSPEHWLVRHKPNYFPSLRLRNGFPRLYETFLANVIAHGVQDLITPLPNTSENAAVILRSLGATAGLVHIDAAHEYDSVLRDLQTYWDLLDPDGLLIADDYSDHWPEVVRACDDFAREVGRPLVAHAGKCFFTRSDAIRVSTDPRTGLTIVRADAAG